MRGFSLWLSLLFFERGGGVSVCLARVSVEMVSRGFLHSSSHSSFTRLSLHSFSSFLPGRCATAGLPAGAVFQASAKREGCRSPAALRAGPFKQLWDCVCLCLCAASGEPARAATGGCVGWGGVCVEGRVNLFQLSLLSSLAFLSPRGHSRPNRRSLSLSNPLQRRCRLAQNRKTGRAGHAGDGDAQDVARDLDRRARVGRVDPDFR